MLSDGDLPPKNWPKCNVSNLDRRKGRNAKEEAYTRAGHQQAEVVNTSISWTSGMMKLLGLIALVFVVIAAMMAS